MPLNLLQIVQEARGRLGQSIPASVAGNTDSGMIQSLGLLNEFLEDLVQRRYWQANMREATFLSVAVESQGLLSALCPFGFEGILPDTFFNRTNQLEVIGGLSPAEWQSRKAANFSGPIPAYRLRGGELLMLPIPTAGHTYSFEYHSSYFIYNAADPTPVYRKYWGKDTDVCTVDDALPIAYLKYAWKREKGLEYAEDFRKYESMLEAKSLRDTRAQVINMGECHQGAMPGMLVTPGSWPL